MCGLSNYYLVLPIPHHDTPSKFAHRGPSNLNPITFAIQDMESDFCYTVRLGTSLFLPRIVAFKYQTEYAFPIRRARHDHLHYHRLTVSLRNGSPCVPPDAHKPSFTPDHPIERDKTKP